MDINTCLATTLSYHTIAYYSHLIPVFITIVLSIFALTKSKFSLLSKIFVLFTLGFCLWLIGDVVIWTQTNYDLINLLWSPLDYINIVFYLLGVYFFVVLVNGQDVAFWQKLSLFIVSLPAWWITITNQSITAFNQPQCEAFNNEFLTQYKLGVEILVLIFIIIFAIVKFQKALREKRKQIVIVGTALVLFFSVFGVTEYISSQTGIYEINLYSLFVLPVFLFMIIYSITSLKVFNMRLIGTQLLAYIMIIMVGSQFFFLQSSTDQTLTVLTFVISLSFGILLVRDAKRELEQRNKIEKLATEVLDVNAKLKEANEGQASLMHFMNHQIKGRFGNTKNIFAELLAGDYGTMPPATLPLIQKGLDETNLGVSYVQGILKGASAESGTLPYDMKPMNMKSVVDEVFAEQKDHAESKKLQFTLSVQEGDYAISGDPTQLREAVKNLIDNSINYTQKGSVVVTMSSADKTILLKVTDTGVGITPEDKERLFKAGGRGTNALKVNVNATGYGLVFVKSVAEAHKGRVWVESEGQGKGSTFYLELPKN